MCPPQPSPKSPLLPPPHFSSWDPPPHRPPPDPPPPKEAFGQQLVRGESASKPRVPPLHGRKVLRYGVLCSREVMVFMGMQYAFQQQACTPCARSGKPPLVGSILFGLCAPNLLLRGAARACPKPQNPSLTRRTCHQFFEPVHIHFQIQRFPLISLIRDPKVLSDFFSG